MKQPVSRQKSMFAPVKGSADCYTHSGFNTNHAKPMDAQPELCHGSGELNLSSAMVGQNVAGNLGEKCLSDTEQKSNPRKIGDPVLVRHRKVSGNAFRSGLDRHRMKIADYARFTGTPENTVKSWSSGRTDAPGTAMAVFRMLDDSEDLVKMYRDMGWPNMP